MSTLRRWRGLIFSLGLLALSPLGAESLVEDSGRFVVNIPAPYERTVADVPTAAGNVKNYQFIHTADANACSVQYADYPAGSVAKNGGAGITCDRILEGARESFKATIRSKAEHRLGDVIGRDCIMDSAEGKWTLRERAYVVGDRAYQVMYMCSTGAENSKEALQFLDSFRLLR